MESFTFIIWLNRSVAIVTSYLNVVFSFYPSTTNFSLTSKTLFTTSHNFTSWLRVMIPLNDILRYRVLTSHYLEYRSPLTSTFRLHTGSNTNHVQ